MQHECVTKLPLVKMKRKPEILAKYLHAFYIQKYTIYYNYIVGETYWYQQKDKNSTFILRLVLGTGFLGIQLSSTRHIINILPLFLVVKEDLWIRLIFI